MPTWMAPLLYDTAYLYLLTVDRLIARGLDYRDGGLVFNASKEIKFIGNYLNQQIN
jgi:hypothetical protein